MRNPHLSVSRVQTYARCPRRWGLTYLNPGGRVDGGSTATRLGTVLHEVLEAAAAAIQLHSGLKALSEGAVIAMYRRKFADQLELTDPEAFEQGLAMVRRWASDLCAPGREILAIEKRWTIRPPVGPPIMGYIDRIDRVGEDAIDVVDYKSSRLLPARWELDSHLQLQVYAAAARRLYPWAKTVRCGLAMLRHNTTLWREYTPEQESSALQYLVTMGQRMEHDTELPARANVYCGWCPFQSGCPALEGAGGALDGDNSPGALLARRMELDAQERAAKAQKARIDEQIKGHLEAGSVETLSAGGVSCRQAVRRSFSMRLDTTARAVAEETGEPVEDVIQAIAKVDQTKLKRFCKARGDAGALALATAEALGTERQSGWLLFKELPWSDRGD